MSTSGDIFRIKKYALHDGPGIRTTIFLSGCPMHCPWCHNPEGWMTGHDATTMGTETGRFRMPGGRILDAEELMTEIEKDRIFYDESGGGVTFSGGEPLVQEAFLLEMLRRCRNAELDTTLDTSGHAPWDIFKTIIDFLDLVLLDLKIMDDRRHRRICGVTNRSVLKNAERLTLAGIPMRIRFPLVPGMTDDLENIREITTFIQSLDSVLGVDILPFHRIADNKYQRMRIQNPMANVSPLTRDDVMPVAERFADAGISITVGG